MFQINKKEIKQNVTKKHVKDLFGRKFEVGKQNTKRKYLSDEIDDDDCDDDDYIPSSEFKNLKASYQAAVKEKNRLKSELSEEKKEVEKLKKFNFTLQELLQEERNKNKILLSVAETHPVPVTPPESSRPVIQTPPVSIQTSPTTVETHPSTFEIPPATLEIPPDTFEIPPATVEIPLATVEIPPATVETPPASTRLNLLQPKKMESLTGFNVDETASFSLKENYRSQV